VAGLHEAKATVDKITQKKISTFDSVFIRSSLNPKSRPRATPIADEPAGSKKGGMY
jgi:hypothetical protein